MKRAPWLTRLTLWGGADMDCGVDGARASGVRAGTPSVPPTSRSTTRCATTCWPTRRSRPCSWRRCAGGGIWGAFWMVLSWPRLPLLVVFSSWVPHRLCRQLVSLAAAQGPRALSVKWESNRGFYVPELKIVECRSVKDVLDLISYGMRNRRTGSHALNIESSRSHAIFTLHCEAGPGANPNAVTRLGKVSFVDLAGSERLKQTKSSGDMLKASWVLHVVDAGPQSWVKETAPVPSPHAAAGVDEHQPVALYSGQGDFGPLGPDAKGQERGLDTAPPG